MDEIEGLRECPGFFTVVDLKLAVWWHPRRLDGGQVGANDLTSKLLFGELYGPDSGSSSDVEDIQAVLRNWGEVEGAVK